MGGYFFLRICKNRLARLITTIQNEKNSVQVIISATPCRRNPLHGLLSAARKFGRCAIAALPHKSTRQRRYHFCGAPEMREWLTAYRKWQRLVAT